MNILEEKCIITAAVTGGDVVPSQSPYLPVTPKEIADDAVRSAEAGAAIVHIHVRNPKTGEPSSDLDLFEEVLLSIKNRCDAIICPTTGGNATMGLEERLRILPRFKPEMATFNLGSMNYATHFITESFDRKNKEFKHDWERPFLESSKDSVFINTFANLEYIVSVMEENQVKPECEIYDLGMVYNAAYLVKKGLLKDRLQIQFVLGVLGGATAEIKNLLYLKEVCDRELGMDQFTWSVIGAGYPQEFHLGAQALIMGGNMRVGLEDNFKVRHNVYARSNAELVLKAVRIAESLDREIASPTEARRILGLKGIDQVAF